MFFVCLLSGMLRTPHPFSVNIVPDHHILWAFQKVTINCCPGHHKLLVRLKDFGQTKHICHCAWRGHDTYVLVWGSIKPQAMVGTKAAHHHGDMLQNASHRCSAAICNPQ